MQAEREVEMRTRDGVILRSDVFRPDRGSGPYPAILVRTPYDKRGNEHNLSCPGCPTERG